MFVNRSGTMRPNKMKNINVDTTTRSLGPIDLRRLRNDSIVSKFRP